ncbi:hypothetical protein PMAYCL1PPCAC_33515, partial [Pristionchus mayeri]
FQRDRPLFPFTILRSEEGSPSPTFSVGKMGRTQHVVFAFLVVAVFLLVAGAIMLTLGIIKFNESPPCDACSTGGSNAHLGDQPDDASVSFASSHVPDVKWKEDLADTTSVEYQKLAKVLENRINKAIEEGRKKRKRRALTSFMNEVARKRKRDNPTTEYRKPKVIVNKIEKNEEGGVNVYLTMIFPDGIK